MDKKDFFISKSNQIFLNVKEVSFNRKNICGNLGKFVNETRREIKDNFIDNSFKIDTAGVYIFQTFTDDDKAYRIYKCCFDYGFNGDKDDVLISKLQELQNKIKLTSFPIGVVTLDNNIIGQEIIYYQDYVPIIDLKDELSDRDLLFVYKKCLTILKELEDNGINYIDVHGRNFLVNKNLDVKLIDFEYDLVKYNDEYASKLSLFNFYKMFNIINKRSNRNFDMDKPKSIDDASNKIDKILVRTFI